MKKSKKIFNWKVVIIAIFVLFLFIIFISVINYYSKIKLYDTIIVGAGFSGLTAACLLKDYKTIIIEKENYIGGRFFPKVKKKVNYNMGAVWRFDTDILPFKIEISYIYNIEPIGIFYKGKILYGENLIECIDKLNLTKKNHQQIKTFLTEKKVPLSKESYKIINSFFQVIHPGEMREYIYDRQVDASIRFNTIYFKNPNEIIKLFKSQITSKILPGSEVISVKDTGISVEIKYIENGSIKTINAKTAIVTTPAPVTKKIVKPINKKTLSFLNSIKYGEITMVAIGLKNAKMKSFSYIITPDLAMNSIHKDNRNSRKIDVVYTYYAGDKSKKINKNKKQKIIHMTIKALHKFGNFSDKNITFTDIQIWKYGGTIISSESFENWDKNFYKASKRIFLAGDYISDNIMPYGLEAAISSGKKAATQILLSDLIKKTE